MNPTKTNYFIAAILGCSILGIGFISLNQSWTYYWNMTESQVSNAHQTQLSDGKNMSFVSVETIDNAVDYTAIWKNSNQKTQFKAAITENEFWEADHTFSKEGYVVSRLETFLNMKNELKLAVVWQKMPGVNFRVVLFKTKSEIIQTIKEYTAKGYKVNSFTSAPIDGTTKYSVCFIEAEQNNTQFLFDLTKVEYRKILYRLRNTDTIPAFSGQYMDKAKSRFFISLEYAPNTAWVANDYLETEDHQEYYTYLSDAGYDPVCSDSYLLFDKKMAHMILWHKPNHGLSKLKNKMNEAALPKGEVIPIEPVVEDYSRWSLYACGEMLFKHFKIDLDTKYSSYQCLIAVEPYCINDCEKCADAESGGAKTYFDQKITDRFKARGYKLSYEEGKALSGAEIRKNMIEGKPILATIRVYPIKTRPKSVLITGYFYADGKEQILVNDPAKYNWNENPYLQNNAIQIKANQYLIDLSTFTKDLKWRTSFYNLSAVKNK